MDIVILLVPCPSMYTMLFCLPLADMVDAGLTVVKKCSPQNMQWT